jgi:hypothetical protein
MRARSVLVLGLLLVAIVPLASGCDQIEKAVKPKPVVKKVTIEPKVGKPGAALQGALKEAPPATLPLWEGATVARDSRVTKSSAGKTWFATLTTPDKYTDVSKGMAVGFQRAQWEVQLVDVAATDASSTVLSVAGGTASGVVTISSSKDNLTQINYVITSSGN